MWNRMKKKYNLNYKSFDYNYNKSSIVESYSQPFFNSFFFILSIIIILLFYSIILLLYTLLFFYQVVLSSDDTLWKFGCCMHAIDI